MKKLYLTLFLLLAFSPIASAEQIPIKITPTQVISTHHDEIEVGDWIRFKVISDIFIGDTKYINKDTPVVGIVDHVHENGLFADNAELTIKKFVTRDVNNQKITIYQALKLNRKDYIAKDAKDKCVKYVGVIFRGSELRIEPESRIYNIFLNI